MNIRYIFVISSVILFCASLFFLPFIGRLNLFDWDEINFAESAREMIVSGDYSTVTINYIPFAEKPPLFIWMQVFSMKIFGINEFAARFPNAICGIVTMISLFFIGRKLAGNNFGIIWSFVHVTGLLPFIYFKSGIMDPWYNFFTFLALVLLYFYSKNNRSLLNLAFSAIFLGLAILLKGPAALLIFLFTTFSYFIMSKGQQKINIPHAVLFFLILLIIGGSWYFIQILKGNLLIVEKFVSYNFRLFSTEDSGHGGNFLYHFYVLFFLVFPASVFALPIFLKKNRDNNSDLFSFKRLMIILFLVVVIIFTIVRTKIIHYSSMAYFPISFLASIAINDNIRNIRSIKKWQYTMLVLMSIIFAISYLLFLSLPLFKHYIIKQSFINDDFFKACLNANVQSNIFEKLLALILPFTTLASLNLFRKNKNSMAWKLLIISYIVFNYIIIINAVPKVERYSQHALIDFCKSKQGENVVNTRNFYSYAPLFYCKVENNKASWPLTNEFENCTNLKVFVILKIDNAFSILKKEPDLKFLYYKNGYVFAKKIKTTN